MPAGTLYWLGPPRVEVNGHIVRLETRKTTAILALLSVDRRPHSRERLAAMFWPEYDALRAPANLRRVLSSLQGSLGTGWLAVDRNTVTFLQNDGIAVDYTDFMAEVRNVRSSPPPEGPALGAENAGKLKTAFASYRGDFLEGFNLKDCPEFDQWQMNTREELLQHASWALERLVEFDSANGRWEESIDEAQRWLALDNLNEAAHRNLMFLFARCGKRGTALQQFQRCRRLIREELGQEPEEQTVNLAERIRLRKVDSPRGGAAAAELPRPPEATVPSPRPPEAASFEEAPPTKLSPPQIRPTRVDRSRLFALLDEGLNKPLTLISAPAGFGKTTLLSEWVARNGLPVAWVSLDEADETPRRFFTSLASALGKADPGVGAEALHMLRAMQAPAMARILESLVRDLSQRPAPRICVLDDYHLVPHAETQRLVSQLIERMPADTHVYISSRVDPPLPLARLRARDQLAELRADALRFSTPEASAFLNRVMGLDLTENDIETLEQRTEGWAAGLQMAALSLQGHQDRSGFIRDFGGSHRYIMDYLIGEVLDCQPEAVQAFLLRTSILRRFRAELCDEVVESTGSQSVLEALDRGNLFTVALDERRTWYRYHHLFAELLRHRLGRERTAEEISLLHERAGRWLEAQDDIDEAMHHYLAGSLYANALRCMNSRYEAILMRGGLGTLLEWAKRIPLEAARGDAGSCVTLGTLYVYAGNAQAAGDHLSRAETLLEDAETPLCEEDGNHLRGCGLTMRAYAADIAGRTEEAISLANRALPLLSRKAVHQRSLIPYILGKAYRYQGDFGKAERHLAELDGRGRAAGNIWLVAAATHEMVGIYRYCGKLREVERALDAVEAMPREPGSEGPIVKIFAHRGELQRERGDLEAAEKTFKTALSHVESWGLPSDLFFCYLLHCRLGLSRGDIEAAEEDILRVESVANSSLVYTTLLPLLDAERIRVHLARGRLSPALAWLESRPGTRATHAINRELLLITEARVLLAAKREEEALRLLERLASDAEESGHGGRLLEIRILQARAESALGREGDARHALGSALSLAAPEGYVRIFLDEGRPIVDLLEKFAASNDIEEPVLAGYARRLAETRPR